MRFSLLLSSFIVTAPVAMAGTVEIVASKDNTLYQSFNGGLSNGSGNAIFCGRTAMGAQRRAVVAFDLEGAIPPGQIVTSATFRLSMAQTLAGNVPMGVHVLLKDWGEGASNAQDGNGGSGAPSQPGDATWVHTFFADELWDNAGGDFEPDASATTMVGGTGFYTWSSEQVTADVNAWLADPASNFGWAVVAATSAVPSAKRFDSRELSDFFAPRLILEIEPAPCPTDLDGSGATDSTDLNIVLSGFGCVGDDCPGDIDGDGDTDSTDLNALLAAFGDDCP